MPFKGDFGTPPEAPAEKTIGPSTDGFARFQHQSGRFVPGYMGPVDVDDAGGDSSVAYEGG